MMQNKLVAAIKSGGKVLREFKDTTYIPFGSEYAILLKNLESVRAIVHIKIDGTNITPDGLVLNPFQEIELERSLANGSLTAGNKFKFIERTGSIEQHRGVKLEDGLIQIVFQFEQPQFTVQVKPEPFWTHPMERDLWNSSWVGNRYKGPQLMGSGSIATGSAGNDFVAKTEFVNSVSDNNVTLCSAQAADGMACSGSLARSLNDVGITVAGSESKQRFVEVAAFPLRPEIHSMVLKLVGETADNQFVRVPITVKTKPKCATCGKLNKATAKFCTDCGTALELFK